MPEFAWLSMAFGDPVYHRAVARDPEWKNYRQANEVGTPLGPDCFPDRFWIDDGPGEGKPLGDMFMGGGFWLVSEKCANILRRFDLGQGNLFPTKILVQDRTSVFGDYFAWNFGNTNAAALPDKSAGVRPPVAGLWRLRATISDLDLLVDQAAVTRFDVWIDPHLLSGLFFSRRLGDALIEADLDGPFSQMKKCRIV